MEGRPNRGRGGSWKRGDRGANGSDSVGGEHRGRGRGGHYRGRGKRDHYRGRGRGGSAHATEFHHRGQDERERLPEEEDSMEVFSRRKLESNWDRYEESEKQEMDDDTPTQRGSDFHVVLESAGDSFTQFRFSEEKDWEKDSFAAGQMSVVFVDLPALAQNLQQVPLHQRLNLEAELVQVSTPVDLPTMTNTPKQDMAKVTAFTPSTPFKDLSTDRRGPAAANPVSTLNLRVPQNSANSPQMDEDEDELNQLLSLQKPVADVTANQPGSVADEERSVPEKGCEEVKEVTQETEKAKDPKEHVTPPKSASVRKEVTEEDLEDWLDSMIS